LYVFFLFPMQTTFPSHLTLLDLIIVIFGEYHLEAPHYAGFSRFLLFAPS
jgi:hypothetical protein